MRGGGYAIEEQVEVQKGDRSASHKCGPASIAHPSCPAKIRVPSPPGPGIIISLVVYRSFSKGNRY